jgi:acyl-CoA reductase-like NAD-dependent aldehyde dehydrogenase
LRGYLLLELFRATGIDVPPGSTTLPEAPPTNVRLIMPPAVTLQALQAAAAGRRRAEASLLASIAAAETPLAELHPTAVAAIVRALRQVGEDHAGRLFAIETAIAHGL